MYEQTKQEPIKEVSGMQITDPIADLLTRIRNASTAKHPSVEVPASNLKKAIWTRITNK